MKSIAIIGGGISGLAVLHYLKQRVGDSVNITLYERNASVGVNVQTFSEDGCLFEKGPNAFLTNQPNTLGNFRTASILVVEVTKFVSEVIYFLRNI